MSINNTIVLNSDNGIRVGGVTAYTDPTIPLAVDGATVTGRLYDKRKVRKVSADTDGDGVTPTLVTVNGAENWIAGEVIELTLDDGAYHNTTVVSIDADTNVITLTAAVAAGKIVKTGTFAKRKLGGDIAMTLYGVTPAPNVDTWGYSGPIADTHEGLYRGKKVRCEVDIDDGAGRRRIRVFEAVVVDG